MIVKDIMKKDFVSIDSNKTVSKVISLMESKNVYEIPIVDNKKLKGIVNLESLVSMGLINPDKTKIKNIISHSPRITPDETIEDAAMLMFKSNVKQIPVVQKNIILGTISLFDVLKEFSKDSKFKKTKIEKIMSSVKTSSINTDIGEVRAKMRNNNFSRVPIVDDDNKLIGLVCTYDVIDAYKRPRERTSWYSMSADKERISSLPITTIMKTKKEICKKTDTIFDVIQKFLENRSQSVVVVENQKPVGIVTLKDILELYLSGLKKEGVYYQVIGLEKEDSFTFDSVNKRIENTIKKISASQHIQNMMVHFKRRDIGGTRARYSVRIRVMTDKGMFMSGAKSWDAITTIEEAIGKLERVFFKKISIKKTDKLRRLRRLKRR